MAKERVSQRDYLDSSGNVTDDVSKAAGARYTLGTMEGDKFVPVASWDELFGEPGKKQTRYGILGFHTKLGNVANSVLNNAKNPGGVKDAATAIEEFVTSPNWREPSAGGGVTPVRYDTAILADVLAQLTGKPADGFAAKMSSRVDKDGKAVAQESDGTWPKGSLTYPAYAMKNAQVRAEYDKRKPSSAGPDIGSL